MSGLLPILRRSSASSTDASAAVAFDVIASPVSKISKATTVENYVGCYSDLCKTYAKPMQDSTTMAYTSSLVMLLLRPEGITLRYQNT